MVLSLAAFILQDNTVTPSSRNLGFIDLFGSSSAGTSLETEEDDHEGHDHGTEGDTATEE